MLACHHDLEGIVAKRKSDPYLEGHASWLKIRNREYSQWAGREELFERERGGDPDFQVWDGCALACNKRRDVAKRRQRIGGVGIQLRYIQEKKGG